MPADAVVESWIAEIEATAPAATPSPNGRRGERASPRATAAARPRAPAGAARSRPSSRRRDSG
jgi:hypothetical protein